MKNTKNKIETEDKDIPEFNFENSVPNKYTSLYSENNKVIILKSNELNTVVLDKDIAEYFPDSSSVNFALRSLINTFQTLKYSRHHSKKVIKNSKMLENQTL